MRFLLFSLVLLLLSGSKLLKINPTQPQRKIKTMPAITPTPLSVWVDTCAARFGVPAAVIWTVGINESGWGESLLARRSNNMFGIKIGDCKTCERDIKGVYRAYPSRYDSVLDFCLYMQKHYYFLIGKPLSKWRLKGYATNEYNFK